MWRSDVQSFGRRLKGAAVRDCLRGLQGSQIPMARAAIVEDTGTQPDTNFTESVFDKWVFSANSILMCKGATIL